ncbi:HAD family hydrolase [Rossellomorea aquimaris]|nr:HAD family hydrolase [Rossellomorea aquimaris]
MKFVFDLDGTICFKGEPLSKEICQALDACMEKGHEIIFASARPIRDLLPVLPKDYHGFRMIGGNGAFTYENEKVNVHTFEEETVHRIKEIIEENQLTYLIDSDWDYSYTGDHHHPIFRNLDPDKRAVNKELNELRVITKVVLFTTDNRIRQKLSQLPVTLYEHGNEALLDISPQGIHKMVGLMQMGVRPGEFVAFGNDQNDLSLFQNAAYSVCVGQHPVKESASTVIDRDEVSFTIKEIGRKPPVAEPAL